MQRLGDEDNQSDKSPTSVRHESDDIVWAAWKHAEVVIKKATITKRLLLGSSLYMLWLISGGILLMVLTGNLSML